MIISDKAFRTWHYMYELLHDPQFGMGRFDKTGFVGEAAAMILGMIRRAEYPDQDEWRELSGKIKDAVLAMGEDYSRQRQALVTAYEALYAVAPVQRAGDSLPRASDMARYTNIEGGIDQASYKAWEMGVLMWRAAYSESAIVKS